MIRAALTRDEWERSHNAGFIVGMRFAAPPTLADLHARFAESARFLRSAIRALWQARQYPSPRAVGITPVNVWIAERDVASGWANLAMAKMEVRRSRIWAADWCSAVRRAAA